jgi:hypothetical protein
MSLYSEFTPDAKLMIEDFGVPLVLATGQTFLAMISDPVVNQTLEAGGFLEQTSFTVKVVATTTSWTTESGAVGGSTGSLSGGVAISALAIGKKATIANLGAYHRFPV